MKNSWGLVPDYSAGQCWKCRLSSSGNPRAEVVIEKSWVFVPYGRFGVPEETARESLLMEEQPSFSEDPIILEMEVPEDNHYG